MSDKTIKPPYATYRSFTSLIDDLRSHDVMPGIIDRSFLSKRSGSEQSALIATLKWFGLTDESGTPTDLHLFGIDAAAGQNREMMWEGIDAILRLWTDPEPYEWTGKFWTVNKPKTLPGGILGFHITPYQDPHPPISVSGVSPNSSSLEKAGERGFIPLSIAFNDDYLLGHWEGY